jgi:serine phosphatase RsbU (regulator of sigma subunit)/anti-sigma regulatory factor (Ser/Thr protein kinase)
MVTLRNLWQALSKQKNNPVAITPSPAMDQSRPVRAAAIEIAPDDPILTYFQNASGVIEIDKLSLDSPAWRAMQAAGVKIIVPLVSQGELIGLINLGPRLSEQDYSTDDRRLLDNLASQAAPAVRIAQLARQQQLEAGERERLAQEMRVARLIQQTLLPQELPVFPGWQVAAHYQPAREVGGDFYDFLYFDDDRLGIVVGDVTDKGVPAAMVMATTRTLLRAVAQQLVSPGQVLERVNDILHLEIPPKMFVTCLYAVLDPLTGQLQYANAGHDLPYRRRVVATGSVDELRATGMPLGLMPGMSYEEKETVLTVGETILFYSDGLVEAHNPQREMFGFPRLQQLMAQHHGGTGLIDFLLGELKTFTGPGWEQEDDVTLVILECTGLSSRRPAGSLVVVATSPVWSSDCKPAATATTLGEAWQTVAEFTFASEPGNERLVAEQLTAAIAAEFPHRLSSQRLEQLKTAVAEATMNAMEHGNQFRPELPVCIQLLTAVTGATLAIRITDHSGGQPIPEPEVPDLEAKLAGLQTPRGWGLFLIKSMVDELRVTSDETHHTVELIMHLEGGKDANQDS